MKPCFPKKYAHDKYVKPVAAATAAFFIQPANMFAINFLNFVITNPNLTMAEARKQFFGTGPTLFNKTARTKMMKGTLMRSVFSSARYTGNFLLLELCKAYEKRCSLEESKESPKFKK
jgi:hypothetical protein